MSGGSFEYLYTKYGSDLAGAGEHLEEMRDQLIALGSTVAAEDTQKVCEAVRQVYASDELRQVWHAVEWWQSCDYSKEQAKAAVVEYDQRENTARWRVRAQNAELIINRVRALCADFIQKESEDLSYGADTYTRAWVAQDVLAVLDGASGHNED